MKHSRNQLSGLSLLPSCYMPSEQRNVTATSLFVVGEIGVNDYLIGLLGNRTLSELKTVFLPRIISAIRSAVTVSRCLLLSFQFHMLYATHCIYFRGHTYRT